MYLVHIGYSRFLFFFERMAQNIPFEEVTYEFDKFYENDNLHLLSDEIYSLSTPKRRKLPVRRLSDISYRSIDRTGQGMNPARIYIVYGMSKDLSSNPFQIGALVPQHDPTVVTTSLCPITLAVVSAPAGKSGQTFSAVPESSSKISSRRTKSSYR